MAIKDGPERRRHLRNRESIFCPISFEYRGMRMQACVRDISNAGAQFIAGDMNTQVELKLGDEIEYTINTYQGSMVCSAKTCWASWIDSDYSWGVEFTGKPSGPGSPFGKTLEASRRG
jgi:hypothetical protein